MVFKLQSLQWIQLRTFKNFGHKRTPVPLVTVLWHGFLTFTFMACCIEHKRLGKFFWGDNEPVEIKAN